MRIKLSISYSGEGLCGFQRQNDLPTVQGQLEAALHKLYGEEITAVGSGRTDAGVHALSQVVHYDCEKEIEPDSIVGALNYYLHEDNIRVISAQVADGNFDARKSAHKKTYFYDMYFGEIENPVLSDRAYFAGKKPDVALMKEAAKLFVGKHDFAPFRCEGSSAKTTVRTVHQCGVEELELYGNDAVRIRISADGFLYKMVRIICGYILRVGQGKIEIGEIEELLKNPIARGNDTNTRKIPLPPQGLYLESVEY